MTKVQGFGGVIDHIATRFHLGNILSEALWVDADHHVDTAAPAKIAISTDTNLIPGWQPLNIRGENIARTDGNPHTEDRFGKHAIGACRSGAVDVGKFDHKIINRFFGLHT